MVSWLDSGGWWLVGVAVLTVVGYRMGWLGKASRKPKPGQAGVVFVRVVPPASNTARKIMVLAVLGGLGWFFWYVMGTRCNGGC